MSNTMIERTGTGGRLNEPAREVYHDTPPTAEELKGNAYAYCYQGVDVLPLRPLTTEEEPTSHE